MFEKRAALLLDYFIGGYFRNINRENLSASVLKGELQLADLELRPEAFADLKLPFRIIAGYFGQFNVRISWTKLKSEPVIINIDRVYLVVGPLKMKGSRMEEREHALSNKRKYLDNEHDQFKPYEEITATKSSGDQQDSFAARLGEKIADNLQVNIERVYIRFEDDSNEKERTAVGVSIKNISAQSTDGDWRPAFIKEASSIIHKLVKLNNFNVVMDCSAPFFSESIPFNKPISESIAWWQRTFDAHYQSPIPVNSLIEPISGVLKAKVNKDSKANPKLPKLWMELKFGDWQLDVTEEQYQSIIRLLELIASQKSLENRELCPAVTPKQNGKVWWKYAINCVVKKIRSIKGKFSWKDVSQFSSKRREYIQLYMIKCDLPWNSQISKEIRGEYVSQLEAMEDGIPLDHVLTYRKVAQAEIRKRVQQHKEMIEKEKEKKGFFSIFSRKQQTTTVTAFKPLDEKEMKLLYDTIDFKPTDESSNLIAMNDNFVLVDFSVHLKLGALKIYKKQSSIPLGTLEFRDTNFSVQKFPRALTLRATFGHFELSEPYFEDSAVKSIVQSRTSKSGRPLIEFTLQTHPPLRETDKEISLVLQPLQIYVNSKWVVEMIKFLKIKDTKVVFLEEMIAQKVSSLKEIAKQNIKNAIKKRSRLKLRADLNAPTFIFPLDYRSATTEAFILSLGRVDISIDPATFTASEAQYATELPPEKFYDKLIVNLSQFFGLLTSNASQNWDTVAASSPFVTPFIDQIDLSLDASLLGLKQLEHLTQTIIDSSFTRPINVYATSSNLRRLLAISKSLIADLQELKNESDGSKPRKAIDPTQLVTETIKKTTNLARAALAGDLAKVESASGGAQSVIVKNLFRGRFSIPKASISIEDDRSGVAHRLALATYEEIALSVTHQNRSLTVDFSVNSMDVKDVFRSTATESWYLVKPWTKPETKSLKERGAMLNVKYCLIHRQSPLYRDTDSSLFVHFTGVDVNIDQETATRLIFFVQGLINEAKSAKSTNITSSVKGEQDALVSEEPESSLSPAFVASQKLSDKISLNIAASLTSVQFNLWKDGRKLVHGNASGFSLSLLLYSSMRLVFDMNIQTVDVYDLTLEKVRQEKGLQTMNEHVVRVKDAKHFLKLNVEIHSPGSNSVFIGKIFGRVASLQFTLVNRFIKEMLNFKTEIQNMTKFLQTLVRSSMASMQQQTVYQIQIVQNQKKIKQPKPIELDILVESPEIIIPQSSDSGLCLLICLGSLNTTNSVKDGAQEISMNLIDIEVMIYDSISVEKTNSIIEKTTLQSRIHLPLQVGPHMDSSVDVFAKLESIAIKLSRMEMGIILKTLISNIKEPTIVPPPNLLNKVKMSHILKVGKQYQDISASDARHVTKNITKFQASINFEIDGFALQIAELVSMEARGLEFHLSHSVLQDGAASLFVLELTDMSLQDIRDIGSNPYKDVIHVGKKTVLLPELQTTNSIGKGKALVFSAQRNIDSTIVVDTEIFRPTVSVIPGFINDVLDFTVSFVEELKRDIGAGREDDGMEDESDAEDATSVTSKSSSQESKSAEMPDLAAKIKVTDLCFQIVEDPTKMATNGIIGYSYIESNVKFTKMSRDIEVLLSKISIYSASMRPYPTHPTPLLKPMDIKLQYNESQKVLSSTNISSQSLASQSRSPSVAGSSSGGMARRVVSLATLILDMGKLDVSLAYSDIQTLLIIAEQFKQIKKPEPGLDDMENDYEPTESSAIESQKPKNTVKLDKLIATFNGVSFGIYNNIYGSGHRIPVFSTNLDIDPLQISGLSGVDDVNSRFTIKGTCEYYNEDISSWEPVVEPFSLDVTYDRESEVSAFSASFPRQLNINASQNMMRTLARAVRSLKAVNDPSRVGLQSRQTTSDYFPYYFHNQTGALTVLGDKHTVSPDEKLPLSDEFRTSVFGGGLKGTLSIDLYIPSITEPVRYNVKSFDSSGNSCLTSAYLNGPKLYYEVKNIDSTKYITLRSLWTFYNNTKNTLDIKLIHEDEELCVIGTVRPNEYRGIPVGITRGNIHVKMSDRGYTWTEKSDEIRIQKPNTLGAIVRSVSTSDRSAFYYFSIRSKGFSISNKGMGEEQTVWFIEDTIQINNAIPYPIDISIRNGPEDTFPMELSCPDASSIACQRKGPNSLIKIKYHKFDWSQEVSLKLDRPDRRTFTRFVLLVKGTDRKLVIQARVHTKGSTKEITFFAPYWIVSHFDHPVYFKSADGLKGVAKGRPEELRKPKLFSFLQANEKSNQLSIKYRDSAWSQPFSLDTVGSSFNVELEDKKNGFIYMIGISISLAHDKFLRTKVVSFSPSLILENLTKYPIQFSSDPSLARPNEIITLNNNNQVTFHPPANRPEPKLCMKIPAIDCDWSGPLLLNTPGFYTIPMRRVVGEDYFAQAFVTSENATTFVSFMEESSIGAPIKISNQTDMQIGFQQKGVNIMRKVPAYNFMRYAFDQPTGEQVIILLFMSGQTVTRCEVPTVTTLVYLTVDIAQAGTNTVRKVDVELHLEGPTRVIKICDEADKRNLKKIEEKKKKQGITSIFPKKKKTGDVKSSSKFKQDIGTIGSVALSVNIPVLGISIIDDTPKELLYLSAYDINITLQRTKASRSIEVSVASMQIDDQMRETIHPVLLHQKIAGGRKILEACVVQSLENAHVDFFNYIGFLFQPIDVRLSDTLLCECLNMYYDVTKLFKPPKETGMKNILSTPKRKTPVDQPRYLYIEELRVYSVEFNLTFNCRDGLKDILSSSSNPAMSILEAVSPFLANIDGRSIALTTIAMDRPFTTHQALKTRIAKSYAKNSIWEIYKVVGGLEIIGKPAVLIEGIAKGVTGLIMEPANAIVKGPTAFGKGIAKGTTGFIKNVTQGAFGAVGGVANAVNSGLSSVTGDSDIRKMQTVVSDKGPTNVAEGVAHGVAGFGTSIFQAVTGVVTKPIEGGKKEGAFGVVKGFGAGVIGLAVKPVAGAMTLVSKTAEGFRQQAEVLEMNPTLKIRRSRPPRHIAPDNVIRPFSLEKSLMAHILSEACGSAFPYDHYEESASVSANLMLFVTNRSLILVRDEKGQPPKIVWTITLLNIQHVTVTSLASKELLINLKEAAGSSSPSGQLISTPSMTRQEKTSGIQSIPFANVEDRVKIHIYLIETIQHDACRVCTRAIA